MDYEGEDRRHPHPQWHLDKGVSISHIFTTLTVVASMVVWAATVERRVALLEASALVTVKTFETNSMTSKENLNMLREDIKEVSKKLDRLAERNK